MKTFAEFVKEIRGVEMPQGEIPGSWFEENRLPMVLRCSCCENTMIAPSARIDEQGYVFCENCARDISES